MLVELGTKSLLNRNLSVSLTILSVAFSVALLLGVERIRDQARSSFTNTISGIDLVVGTRSGSVQLLLSSVFRLGVTADTVSWKSYQEIAQHPQVAWTIPISLGDSYKGYGVVGTTSAYLEHMKYGDKQTLAMASGNWFDTDTTVVLGSHVARELQLALGDEIVLAHGAGDVSFIEHHDHPYVVSGILAPTATPIDQAVYISLEGYTSLHKDLNRAQDPESHDPLALVNEESMGQGISAFFVGLKSRSAALGMQRMINQSEMEPMTAVMPAATLLELWEVVAVVERSLLAVSCCVVIVGLAGMLVVMISSLNERRREMAILRSVGARPAQVFMLLTIEAGIITLCGLVLGFVLLLVAISVAAPILLQEYGLVVQGGFLSSRELVITSMVLAAGLAAGVIPATVMTRLSLKDGLAVRF